MKSFTLGIAANETAQAIASQQRALDSLARRLLDNKVGLDYILTEKGGMYVVANSSCYVCINITSEVKTYLDKIRQKAAWLQRMSSQKAGFDLLRNIFSWIPARIRSMFEGLVKLGIIVLCLL